MSFAEIWLLAVSLAIDCFTVSVTSGIILHRIRWGIFLKMAFFFGLFQAAMPLIGGLRPLDCIRVAGIFGYPDDTLPLPGGRRTMLLRPYPPQRYPYPRHSYQYRCTRRRHFVCLYRFQHACFAILSALGYRYRFVCHIRNGKYHRGILRQTV